MKRKKTATDYLREGKWMLSAILFACLCLTSFVIPAAAASPAAVASPAGASGTSQEAADVLQAIEDGMLDGKVIDVIYITADEIRERTDYWGKDNSRAFQNVVQEKLNEARDNKKDTIMRIVLPAGEYDLATGYLSIYSNTILDCRGNGVDTPLDTTDDDASVHIYAPKINGCNIRCGRKSDESSGYTTYQNMTILGGTWHSTRQTYSSEDEGSATGSQIRFGHASNVRLIGLKVQDNVGAHHVEIGATKNLQVSDCSFSGFADGNLEGGNNERSIEALQLDITHRQKDNLDGFGEDDDLPVVNAIVNNCTFDNVRRGVGSHHAVLGMYYSNIQIINNTFTNIPDRCINAVYMKDVTISGNVMTNVVSGIFASSMIPNQFYQPRQDNGTGNKLFTKPETFNADMTIQNNQIELNPKEQPEKQFGSYKYGIKVGGDELTAKDSIDKNTDIKNAGKEGYPDSAEPMPSGSYYMSNVTLCDNKVLVQETTADKNVDYALLGWCLKDSAFSGNIVNLNGCNKTDEASAGIKANASQNVTFTNNTIFGVTNGSNSSGIFVTDGSKLITVADNMVGACAKNGITISKSSGKVEVKGNVIQKAGKNGIDIYQSSVITVSGNIVSGSGKDGITLSDKSTVNGAITGNTVTESKAMGISAKNGSRVTGNLMKNTVNNTGADGVCLHGSTAAEISENTLSGTKGNGICLSTKASAKSITKNTVSDPGSNGILIYNGSTVTTVSSNTVKKPKSGDGIALSTKGNATTISGNTVTTPKLMGISLRKTSNTKNISTNTITTPGHTGIYINASKITNAVRENKITSAKANSIAANAKSTVKIITKNIVKAATKNGILVYDNSTVTTISSNAVNGAKEDGISLSKKAKVTTISSNTLSSSGKMGISLRTGSTAANVKSNTVNISGNKGIFLADQVSRVTAMESNTIKKAKKHGFYAVTSPMYLIGNKLSGNGNNKLVSQKGIAYKTKAVTIKVGKSATPATQNSVSKQKIAYKSSKAAVATVNAKGKVTAKKAGTAVITATKDGYSTTCKITVKK